MEENYWKIIIYHLTLEYLQLLVNLIVLPFLIFLINNTVKLVKMLIYRYQL